MVVGVNGTGKTTTTGKLARVLVADGRSVVLGAADTFRAAAADQLQTWGERVGARTVRGPEARRPRLRRLRRGEGGQGEGADVVLIDTAGRLHTKTGLMDELGKVKRVVEKHGPLDEVLLVLDATTGQNGLVQARVFAEVVDITGIVLTKLDGTAKGGIVIAVQRELGVPVKLVGLGEGADDLAPFEPGGVRRRADRRLTPVTAPALTPKRPPPREPRGRALRRESEQGSLRRGGGAVRHIGQRAQQQPGRRRARRRVQRPAAAASAPGRGRPGRRAGR